MLFYLNMCVLYSRWNNFNSLYLWCLFCVFYSRWPILDISFSLWCLFPGQIATPVVTIVQYSHVLDVPLYVQRLSRRLMLLSKYRCYPTGLRFRFKPDDKYWYSVNIIRFCACSYSSFHHACVRRCCFWHNIAVKFVNSTIFARTYNIIWTSASLFGIWVLWIERKIVAISLHFARLKPFSAPRTDFAAVHQW